MIHERFCCNRGFAALAREVSFVNRERDKQDVRDRRDLKFEVRDSKFRKPRTSDLELSPVSPFPSVPPVSRSFIGWNSPTN